MNRAATILILLLAALLEAGGDALVRVALRAPAIGTRVTLFAVAALVLLLYGYVVNAPGWDFGRLLGIYVVFFFVIAQVISWVVFRQAPSMPMVLGGLLIVSGGLVIGLG
jgi:drug/metabolite transporter superfamily protein YnfA